MIKVLEDAVGTALSDFKFDPFKAASLLLPAVLPIHIIAKACLEEPYAVRKFDATITKYDLSQLLLPPTAVETNTASLNYLFFTGAQGQDIDIICTVSPTRDHLDRTYPPGNFYIDICIELMQDPQQKDSDFEIRKQLGPMMGRFEENLGIAQDYQRLLLVGATFANSGPRVSLRDALKRVGTTSITPANLKKNNKPICKSYESCTRNSAFGRFLFKKDTSLPQNADITVWQVEIGLELFSSDSDFIEKDDAIIPGKTENRV
ncbi:unnamed protein product [Vitrella brassicaformis CCMP3155]|uniref:Uncharacterized protein n=1 Tax=Vitrella brassicaformis (strain CCMP3155) TaxID=1169540 RepID=A0A0G4G446_VITBC|nr:unnamed protein product [Vitrella brassicaformis CCMP3155]|eukprot:CEM23062.1 unnamed protein product [Vitrella brassicaformis CCMP3155]